MTSASQSKPLRVPAECVIKVDGVELSQQTYRLLREVKVSTGRKAAALATLVFDSFRSETGDWLPQDASSFLPWKSILIEACFGNYTEEIMRGFIRQVKADCPAGSATFTVIAQDETLLLDREHVRKSLSTQSSPMADGQIAQQIASDHGLSAQTTPGLANTSLNCDSTYIRLLQDRAEANGFEVYVRAGQLYFGPPQLTGTPQETITVRAGYATNCLRFSVNFDGHKPDQVRLIRPPDTGSQTLDQTMSPNLTLLGRDTADSSNAGLVPFVWTIPRPTGTTATEAQSRAQARANDNAWKLQAEGELDGTLYGHVLLTHATVRVDGLGDTYSGLYYVDEVEHTFNAQGYRQAFKLLRNALGDQQGARNNRLNALL